MKKTTLDPSSSPSAPVPGYRIHWHVFLTHFPLSFFGAAFGFQLLHLFIFRECFEVASNVTLIAGTIMLMPTTLTGWRSWKSVYRGTRDLIFRRKILIAFIMLGLSIPLTIWRVIFLDVFSEVSFHLWHWIYFVGNTLLILGATGEGFYGARLHHK